MHDRVVPRVSIGLPVFNGEAYLGRAIESLLEQTYRDFELIICDNASNDATASICRRFAGQDTRIRYHRHPTNIGAAPNFNYCYKLARGEYFKWAAHDDILAPNFLTRAVALLDRHPDVVLAFSVVHMVDGDGHLLGRYDPGQLGTDAARPSDRFWGRLKEGWCKEIFGLIRSSALAQTSLLGGFGDADRVLAAELALLGRFEIHPEPLFVNRDHAGRYTRSKLQNPNQNLTWYTAAPSSRFVMQRWRLYGGFIRAIGRHPLDRAERWRCYWQLARSSMVNWQLILLALDPIVALEPRLLVWTRNVKRKLIGYKKASSLFEPAETIGKHEPPAKQGLARGTPG